MSAVSDAQLESLMTRLVPFGQEHILKFWPQLDSARRSSLANQIRAIDWEQLRGLVQSDASETNWNDLSDRATAPTAITIDQQRDPDFRRQAEESGNQALANGQVAFVLTAGGQGSRLGFEHPKGMFPIGPVSNRSLFQIMLEHCLARGSKTGGCIPVYIMTSPQTDAETREYLESNDWFGYRGEEVRIFCQGGMPAVDLKHGKVLMADKHELVTSPDGHGGALAALDRSGSLDDMHRHGIRQVFYGQIDNPLLLICDPVLIGCHLLEESELTSQVIRKREALQRVGNVVSIGGKVQIIEYSDLPEKNARAVDANGDLKLWAGSIAVHIFELDFLQRCAKNATSLPFHRAEKKIPAIDSVGQPLEPTENNGVKFERFIFDLMPHAEKSIVCEVDPSEGFAAVKNSPPATSETPDWVRAAICRLHRSWIESAGGTVDDGVLVEISPAFALDAEALKRRLPANSRFQKNTFLQSDSDL